MADEIGVRIEGLAELVSKIEAIVPALRKRAVRMALSAGARIVRDKAKADAPVLQRGRQSKYRTPGLLKKAIGIRTSKVESRRGHVGVFVNVRPAKAGERGAKSRKDPYYWRWQEFGWTPAGGTKRGFAGLQNKRARRQAVRAGVSRQMEGKGFLSNAGKLLPSTLPVIERRLADWFEKTNASGKVNP